MAQSVVRNLTPIVVAALGLGLLVMVAGWWFEHGCRGSGLECLVPLRPDRYESLLAIAGLTSGVGLAWMVGAGWAKRKLQTGMALALAVSAAGIGRWWAGPLSPLEGARHTDHHLLLLIFAGVIGACWATLSWTWYRQRTRLWALAAATVVMATGLLLLSSVYGVSYIE